MKNLHNPLRFVLYLIILQWFAVENGGALQAFVLGLFLCDLERNTPIFTYLTHSRTLLSQSLRWSLSLTCACLWVYAQAHFGFVAQTQLPPGNAEAQRVYNRWTSWGTFCCLVFLQLTPPMQWLLASPPARFVGYISFCLYLVHGEIYNTFSAFLFLKLYRGSSGDGGGGLSYLPTTGVVFLASVAVIVPLAWLMTVLVDDPAVRVSRTVYQNFFMPYDEKIWLHRQGRRVWGYVGERWRKLMASSVLGPVLEKVLYAGVPALGKCRVGGVGGGGDEGGRRKKIGKEGENEGGEEEKFVEK
jgi:peptidoglycan/LPS O-acetylase OafA/YrhL